ncbi:hypothetical protein KTG68_14550 [Acinetobacter variabilis]|jgi:hypothetical protein|uniref:hypothetical protein n=1 Tax=Acinetobacter variabilis TaxID=70346 RepID=UPI0021D18980|nr:hypothetical protein [Acinetobacter variabilis]MCU4313168.1 hypothetical protein [Acinetobacter variabilis]
MFDLNLANALFEGFNDKEGVMICGYEWGWSKADQAKGNDEKHSPINFSIPCTFSNKVLRYGEQAKSWRYDNTIKKWFSLWGHSLNEYGLGSEFDKCIIQTNWAYTSNHSIDGYERFLEEDAINNFLQHVEELRPKIILFMGRNLIDLLRNEKVWNRFTAIVGNAIGPLKMVQKKEYNGTRFKVFFEKFETCKVICFPHPSSSRGLSNEYISLFKPEMDKILTDYKQHKSIN